MEDPTPKIELLWWEGCPSWPEALVQLKEVMFEFGLRDDVIDIREIETEEAARQERFAGSPTIRIDGQDVEPPQADEPIGLTCRIYRLPDGRFSPLPDRAKVRDALELAVERMAAKLAAANEEGS